MRLGGMQKLTLLDYPEKLACTLFAAGCNYRCPFCHNASLVLRPEPALEAEEALAFLRRRRGVLQGVCLTGGEPLLQPDAEAFLRRIRELGYAVKLDTNGALPDRLIAVVEAGLVDYVAMDVKNCPAAYGETVGIDGYDTAPVDESIRYLLSGKVEYEFRTTVVRQLHSGQRLRQLAEWIAGAGRYFLQSFLDSGDLIRPGLSGYDAAEMEALRETVAETLPCVRLRGV